MQGKRLWEFQLSEMGEAGENVKCSICSLPLAKRGFEIGQTKIEARIRATQGFMCGECAAHLIAECKFNLERR